MIATTPTTKVSFAASDSVPAKALSQHRHRMTPEVGRAMEKLGHAIEYLTDEFVREGGWATPDSPHRMEAVQVLMALRRRIHQEAPEVQPLGARCRTFVLEWLN